MSQEKKILIIDDETDLCLLLKDYFVRKQYSVFLSHTLEEGEKILNNINPDILFLDNNLPDGIGWNNAPSIAVMHPSTFIVLVSAFHPEVPQMPENTRYKVIEKPISIADLDSHLAYFA